METPDVHVDGDPTPLGLRVVRDELDRIVEHRVLGGLSDREQRRYDELTSIEERILEARARARALRRRRSDGRVR